MTAPSSRRRCAVSVTYPWVAVKARRKYVVMNLRLGSGPNPTVEVTGSPYPSGAAPVFQEPSSKLRAAQVGPGLDPSSRYRQLEPAGMSVSSDGSPPVRNGPLI